MARIIVNNPRQVINGGAKKYYFKVKGLGGPKGDKGDKGDTGQTGPQGPQGNAATVSVGSTTTLPVGYDATVENVGSIYNAVLNFGIPQGPQGPQGATGAKGDKGDKGDQGNPGPQGERGTNATVYIGTTTTTNPGTQARVYNSGTDSNAVLNFEIPRGDVGPMPEIAQTTGTSTTTVMSQNATTEALNNGLAAKQDKLTAGSNITISGNTISAKDTTYTAGDNIQINGSTISATDTTYTAGANIQIENGTISATDTTYTAGNGLNLNGTEFSADTDVLATKEDLEGYYTKPETDNLLAPKLEAEVVTELPTTGAEGKLYLTPKAHTTQTATGNPITATVAEEAGVIESFQLDGDTFQQSYTGKNLLAINRISTETKNGVTCTWNGASFTLDGTSTASTDFYGRGWWGATSDPIALPAGTYTMSLRKSDGSLATDANFSIDCYYGTTWIIGIYRGNSGAGYRTLTLDSDTQYSVFYISLQSGETYNNEKFYIQLEKSESPTSYEPYVGGHPRPSPDYPQPIQTVTGEQTVEVVGKNLFDGVTTNQLISNTGEISSNASWDLSGSIAVSPNTTYTVSWADSGRRSILISEWNGDSFIRRAGTQGQTTYTFTTDSTTDSIRLNCNNTFGDTDFQIELGSTASPFAPYSATNYPISLGSIELCKLGTYQDYIWKDGESWKVHKATGKYSLVNGSELGENGIGADFVSMLTPELPTIAEMGHNSGLCRSNMYIPADRNGTGLSGSTSTGRIRVYTSFKYANTYNGVRAIAQEKGLVIYYPLATPTDTVITDQALIDQLEAIRTASLQNGANIITNTATGTNLAGDMEISYYGYNPTNRYDKWLWLDLNNAYEQLNSPDTSSTLSTLSTRSLGTTAEQQTVTRSLETETITLKKGEAEPIEDKTGLPTIQDEETEEAETTEPEESDGTDER